MSRLPALTGRDVVRALERAGFEVLRQRGNHNFMTHPDGRTTVVPVHSGESIGRGLIGKILDDVGMSREEFIAHLRRT